MNKVWIVDDDEEMVQAVQLMFKLLDCETRYFFSPRPAAQALLSNECPDLLVLDINLGEVSGIDLLEFIRRRPEWKELPVIMLSTEASDVMVDRALALGADAYVTKPVALDELEAAMNKALLAHGKRK
jgi:two-component system phosphate regulon response regulator PhoB